MHYLPSICPQWHRVREEAPAPRPAREAASRALLRLPPPRREEEPATRATRQRSRSHDHRAESTVRRGSSEPRSRNREAKTPVSVLPAADANDRADHAIMDKRSAVGARAKPRPTKRKRSATSMKRPPQQPTEHHAGGSPRTPIVSVPEKSHRSDENDDNQVMAGTSRDDQESSLRSKPSSKSQSDINRATQST